jgi:hypothetical protein
VKRTTLHSLIRGVRLIGNNNQAFLPVAVIEYGRLGLALNQHDKLIGMFHGHNDQVRIAMRFSPLNERFNMYG